MDRRCYEWCLHKTLLNNAIMLHTGFSLGSGTQFCGERDGLPTGDGSAGAADRWRLKPWRLADGHGTPPGNRMPHLRKLRGREVSRLLVALVQCDPEVFSRTRVSVDGTQACRAAGQARSHQRAWCSTAGVVQVVPSTKAPAHQGDPPKLSKADRRVRISSRNLRRVGTWARSVRGTALRKKGARLFVPSEKAKPQLGGSAEAFLRPRVPVCCS